MNTILESLTSTRPSAVSRAMIERLIGFQTVSRDSNLGLIEWVRDYLQSFGAATRLTYDPTGTYFHPDHVKSHLVTSAALDVLKAEGWEPRKLYWNAIPRSYVEEMAKRMAEAGRMSAPPR